MKINENILKQLIEIPNNIYELTNAHITEVDSFGPQLNINNLVIGQILEIKPHENADKLSVTKVNLGTHTEQIVCGASNIEVGQYVVVAKEGAILPGNFIIKPTKIRGIESNGMICSLDELGFAKELIPAEFSSGIYYFKNEQTIGSNALEPLALNGFIMELDLTPNRSDLLSHYGFAKDLSAIIKKDVILPKFSLTETAELNPLKVTIESVNTNSYYARYIKDVKIEQSPLWLKSTLLSMGCNPVNNVVDITNYLLYMYGLPMHAFDANKFNSLNINVKDNDQTRKIMTLDDTEIMLTNGEILITNNSEPMALGGIMGLKNSMVTNETNNIILEVASFDSKTIQNISKQVNLTSDSQLRFARGINEELIEHVINHAAFLMQELAGGKVLKGISSNVVKTQTNPLISIDPVKINKMLGTTLLNEEIKAILVSLNYEVKSNNNELFVKAPLYRNDIKIFADVTEEIARIYGVDNIESKPLLSESFGALTNKQRTIRTIRNLLANMGLNEIITYSLLREEDVNTFSTIGEKLSVLKPMTSDRRTLRQSLLNGGIEVLNYNKNRSITNMQLFEIGNVYAKDIEQKHLAIFLTGTTNELLWDSRETKIDFYYLSGLLEKLMKELKIDYSLKASNNEQFHPFQQASIIVDKKVIGTIAKLHPSISLSNDTYVLELNLEKLMTNKAITFNKISKFPNVERDIAVVLKLDITAQQLLNLIKQTAKPILVDTYIFDVYKGSNILEDHQSIAVRMIFNDSEKTLENSDVDKVIKKIITRIEREFAGMIRT